MVRNLLFYEQASREFFFSMYPLHAEGAWKKIFSVTVSFANMSWMRQHLFVYAKNSDEAS